MGCSPWVSEGGVEVELFPRIDCRSFTAMSSVAAVIREDMDGTGLDPGLLPLCSPRLCPQALT